MVARLLSTRHNVLMLIPRRQKGLGRCEGLGSKFVRITVSTNLPRRDRQLSTRPLKDVLYFVFSARSNGVSAILQRALHWSSLEILSRVQNPVGKARWLSYQLVKFPAWLLLESF